MCNGVGRVVVGHGSAWAVVRCGGDGTSARGEEHGAGSMAACMTSRLLQVVFVGCTGIEWVQLISFLSSFPDGLLNIQGGLPLYYFY
jgi:hypothetical protein